MKKKGLICPKEQFPRGRKRLNSRKEKGIMFSKEQVPQMFDKKLQGLKFDQIKCSLYHWKALKT
jgi:hypothetical protein